MHITKMDSKLTENVRKVLRTRSSFAEPTTDSSKSIIDFLMKQCKILVIGAGGLGCEIIKDLVLMGIRDIHVIDMDTIELSNLNRQFLFSGSGIGQSKAIMATQAMLRMVPNCNLIPHHAKIQDFDAQFYEKFNIIICGLDSIEARRWINNMVVSLLKYDEQGELDQSSVIPLIDGGTEGLKGNARVILPGITACIECNLDLYPPPINYPICTIANKPRLPEHTIEYASTILWTREKPFQGNTLNIDDPEHIGWIHEKAVKRAKEFGIEEPTIKFTHDVIHRTLPAVSSTNACIAATCVTEAFKLITSCARPINNFQILNLSSGIYSYIFEAERKEDCLVCGRPTIFVTEKNSQPLTT